jgi:MFS family permease
MHPPQPNLIANLRALPRPAWILFIGTFLNRFGSFVIPFLVIYLRARGYDESHAAIALAAYGFGHLAASAAGGYLTDRIGRRKTIALSMFSSAASMLLLSQAGSFPTIVLFTALTGLTAEMYRPASGALLTDLVTPAQRVTAFAAYRWALNAGWAFGPATAGFLAKHSFQWLFIGDAITSTLFGIVAWFALPHGVRASGTAATWPAALRVMRHDKRLHRLLLAQLAIALVFLQMSSTFGLHVTSAGFSPAAYGALISLNGVLVVLFELPLITFTQRSPIRPTIAVGYVLIGLGFTLVGMAHTLPWLIVVVVLFTVGEMIAMPVASAYIAESVPPDMRGRYMGAYGFIWALGLTVGPGIGLHLHARVPSLLWGGCGVLGLIAAVLVLRSKHETAAPPASLAAAAVEPNLTKPR